MVASGARRSDLQLPAMCCSRLACACSCLACAQHICLPRISSLASAFASAACPQLHLLLAAACSPPPLASALKRARCGLTEHPLPRARRSRRRVAAGRRAMALVAERENELAAGSALGNDRSLSSSGERILS